MLEPRPNQHSDRKHSESNENQGCVQDKQKRPRLSVLLRYRVASVRWNQHFRGAVIVTRAGARCGFRISLVAGESARS